MLSKTPKTTPTKSGSIAPLVRLSDWRPLGTCVHRKQLGSADILAFPLERLDHRRPGRQRDALAFAPLGDGPMTLTNVVSHGRKRRPALKKVAKVSHTGAVIEVDGLSSQAATIGPVTRGSLYRTIRPVGRGASPSLFKREVAKRLEAARIAAGYGRQEDFVKLLGCGLDAYRKYEQGRTVIPAHYLPRFRELTGKDANFLFDTEPMTAGKKAVA